MDNTERIMQLMERLSYQSVFKPYMIEVVRIKLLSGVKAMDFPYVYKEFDDYIIKENIQSLTLTQDILGKWISEIRKNVYPSTLAAKISIIRQLCNYLNYMGHPCYTPRIPRHWKDFVPHVFTYDEMAMIFKAADALRLSMSVKSSHIMGIPCIIRLLYATGMRIGEVTALNLQDIDFEKKVIIIQDSKNKEKRLIPLTASLECLLRRFLSERKKLMATKDDAGCSAVFINAFGKRVLPDIVGHWFNIILKECGIEKIGHRQGAHLHCLRHTFAVHSLINQVRKGRDMYNALPYLSAILGHKSVEGTETYIRLTKEMFPDIVNKTSELGDDIIPQVF